MYTNQIFLILNKLTKSILVQKIRVRERNVLLLIQQQVAAFRKAYHTKLIVL